MGKHVKPDYHEYKTAVRRFSTALTFADNRHDLVAAMLGACVVTLSNMSAEDQQEVASRVDRIKVWHGGID